MPDPRYKMHEKIAWLEQALHERTEKEWGDIEKAEVHRELYMSKAGEPGMRAWTHGKPEVRVVFDEILVETTA